MHIGIDASRASATNRTGTEAYAFRLINAFLPLAQANGHRVSLYVNGQPEGDWFESRLAQTVNIPFPRLWTHLRLARELAKNPPDVFFTPAHVIPLTYRSVSVATVHDLGYHYFPKAHTKNQERYLRWSTRHNARRSTIVLADSHATKDDLTTFYGTPPNKIRVVYPAYDKSLAHIVDGATLTATQQKYGIAAPYLLFLSTLQPRKNVVRLVEAFGRIASHIPHQLVLAGKRGWLADQIDDAIANLPSTQQQRIKMIGFVDEADKAAILSGASALLYPSLYEGFGFPVLEAQVCRVPVLTATNSSLPEVAGQGALFVDAKNTQAIADGILQLLGDGDRRASLIELGQFNLTRFRWLDSAEKLLNILEQVAA